MESMEERITALEAQLLAHRVMLLLIYAEAPPAMHKQLQNAAGSFATLGLMSELPDDMLETIRQELALCAPPPAPPSGAAHG